MRFTLVAAVLAGATMGALQVVERRDDMRLGSVLRHANELHQERMRHHQPTESYHFNGAIGRDALPSYCASAPSPSGGYDITCF